MIAEILTFGARVACVTFLVGGAILGAIAAADYVAQRLGYYDRPKP